MFRFKFALVVPFVLTLVLFAACNGTGANGNDPNILFSTLLDDADNDGIADEQDGCPDDADKTEPGQCGCGESDADSDQDGVADCNDECPNNELKTEAGDCGCSEAEDDTDEDGTPDCVDECPNNADKTEAGDCGCTAADTDSDEDGTADCVDGCPDDAGKTSPGVCGCGESDADSDEDGTPDCNDGCPSDELKTSPGDCGCGFGDTNLIEGGASITFVVDFNDPDAEFTEYYEDIERNLLQASNDWAALLSAPSPVSIEIQLSFINHEVAAATAASMTSVFVRDNGDFLVFEQGVAAEIRTGIDPNGDTPDAQVNLDIDTMVNHYWFDPDPAARTEPIPDCEFVGGQFTCFLDAYSILAHEMGHAFAYNGLRDADTGEIGEFGSTFDDQINVIDGSMFFVGAEAVAVNGSNVPLADPAHLNLATLMNPIIDFGVRNSISDIDTAILDDVGIPMATQSNECAPSTPSVRSVHPMILGPKPEPRGCWNKNCPHTLKAKLRSTN